MPRILRITTNSLLLAVLMLGVAASTGAGVGVAYAQSDIAKVTDLNKKALTAYDDLEIDDAKKFLMQALQICASAGLDKHPIKARTLVHLGVILYGGAQDKDGAIRQFQKALEIMPEVTLTASLVNPEIKALFDQAKAGMGKVAATTTGTDKDKEKETEKQTEDAEKAKVAEKEAADKAAAEAEKAAADKAAANDGSPPTDVTGIFHEPVPTAAEGQKIEIKAAVEKAMNANKVVLAYRPEGAIGFLARDMEADEAGWYVARIPEPATKGKLVHYYIEARNKSGQAIANDGSLREPHVIALGAAGAEAEVADDSVVADDHEDPLKHSEGEDGPHPTWMVAFGLGSGYGITSGSPEVTPTESDNTTPIKFKGAAPSGTVVLSPEIGYYLGARLILSLQARLQILTGLTEASELDGNGDVVTYSPAKGAFAVFAKATYLLGTGRFRPFVSAAVGGGEVRHVVNIGNLRGDCGANMDLECIDTVKAGPFLFGPGGGLRVGLTDAFTLVAAVNALVGVPNSTFNFDFNVGLAFGL